ncbi:MAG: hypothetical protein D4S01_10400 [Dehalococcoidia bacterium]|nr:MAG: hypothetical protein D4S01_10400 [Dehalococcoidia bacterium]
MNFQLVASKPTADKYKEIYVTEWAWRPIRSMLAIANHLNKQAGSELIVHPDKFRELDEVMGEGLNHSEACVLLGGRLKELMSDPSIVESYGMTVDLLDGEFVFTYPPQLCTSAMQHKESKNIINTNVKAHEYDTVHSMLRASEKEISEVIDFLINCGGFLMP